MPFHGLESHAESRGESRQNTGVIPLSPLLNRSFLQQDLLNHEVLTLADRPQMNLCFLKLFFVMYLFPQYQEK